jgi:hypothetical protein
MAMSCTATLGKPVIRDQLAAIDADEQARFVPETAIGLMRSGGSRAQASSPLEIALRCGRSRLS